MENSRGFDSEWLQKLRDSNDLVAIASKYVYVKRQGRKFWACCPFHHEKTPSFCINPDEQFFHCFGCGESGDVITLVMKLESLDFMDAVKLLADKSGLTMPEFKGEKEIFERKQKKERMLALLKDANNFYRQSLQGGNASEALAYIEKRKLGKAEIDKFGIGYSPSWEGVVNFLLQKGYKREELLEVGMASPDEQSGKLRDFFGLRLMFPLYNKFGDCIGFSGRDIRGTSKAKYKNSIQSLVFDKSSTVFALNHVKNLKQTQNIDHIIICEGQMDVIAMHKAGFTTSVACLGTAITEAHAREIKRVTDKVILCLDGDEAGVTATLRAIPILKAQMLEVRVATLSGGKDPDEIITTHGVDYMSNLINSAQDCIEYQIKAISKKYNLEDGTGKSKFLNEVFALMKNLQTMSEREYYIPLISKLSNVAQRVIREDVSGISYVSEQEEVVNIDEKLSHQADALLQAQRFILASLIDNKDYAVIDADFDLCLLDKELIDFYTYIKEERAKGNDILKGNVYDKFGENNQTINACLYYDFDSQVGNLKDAFVENVNYIKKYKLDDEIDDLNKKIKETTDNEQKRELVLKLSQKIKEKQNFNKVS